MAQQMVEDDCEKVYEAISPIHRMCLPMLFRPLRNTPLGKTVVLLCIYQPARTNLIPGMPDNIGRLGMTRLFSPPAEVWDPQFSSSVVLHKTWDLVDLPPSQRPIGLKWGYKVKRDERGAIVKHKARLVAKGYVQKARIDFEEVFVPVAHMESVRLLLAVAAHAGWGVHHMDVKSAFLNRELAEEVYVQQPSGFAVDGQEHKVYGFARHSHDSVVVIVRIYRGSDARCVRAGVSSES
ncbi:hypothetical protein E2562_016131 [Oryza meyeriana var. granulata]|uniref:Reverse transcriptase Ty1/copia-type domain-containing protein n=1 Tax=Oryza meyeriana var. granulata TaxID=110450 RepID=A0A6G1F8K3_9ORYZ|nr:hypothetical protein E2562_016131 [Oryza meyeriana var. granulata]